MGGGTKYARLEWRWRGKKPTHDKKNDRLSSALQKYMGRGGGETTEIPFSVIDRFISSLVTSLDYRGSKPPPLLHRISFNRVYVPPL